MVVLIEIYGLKSNRQCYDTAIPKVCVIVICFNVREKLVSTMNQSLTRSFTMRDRKMIRSVR